MVMVISSIAAAMLQVAWLCCSEPAVTSCEVTASCLAVAVTFSADCLTSLITDCNLSMKLLKIAEVLPISS